MEKGKIEYREVSTALYVVSTKEMPSGYFLVITSSTPRALIRVTNTTRGHSLHLVQGTQHTRRGSIYQYTLDRLRPYAKGL